MDTVGSPVGGYLPILEDLPPQNEDGVGGMHMYMPWWLYKQQKAGKMPFARGYHIEIGGGRGLPEAGELGGSERILGGGYGVDLKRNLRKIYGCNIYFAGRGEMIPNEDSYCEIDPNVVDQWGIPVLRFHFKWSQDEILQAKHMQETFQEIITAAGGKVTVRLGSGKRLGHFAGRSDHSRSGRDKDRRQSQNIGTESVLPGVGLQESFHHRRRAVCQQRGQKSDTDDYRAGLADIGVHCRAGEEKKRDRLRNQENSWKKPGMICRKPESAGASCSMCWVRCQSWPRRRRGLAWRKQDTPSTAPQLSTQNIRRSSVADGARALRSDHSRR